MPTAEPGVWSTAVPNRSPTLIIVCIVFLVVTTAFFGFRQGWRWAHRQRGLDDLLAACAYIVLVIQTVFGGIAVHYGFGKHGNMIKPTLSKALLYFYLYQICYKLLGGFTKLTFCALYLRIFADKPFNRLVLAVSAIVAVGSLAFALGTVFQCMPVQRAWDHRVEGSCISNTAFWYTHAAFNIFFDVVVFIMPIPMIRTLKLHRGQKTGLISIFCLGAFVIVAAIVRMVMLYASAGSTDPTWGSMIALYWTEIEANTSVICCCLPALRVPFLNIWHRVRYGKPSSAPPSTRRPSARPRNDIWSGPQQSEPTVSSELPQKPHRVRHHPSGEGSSLSWTRGKEMSSNTSSGTGDKWYGRIVQMSNHDRDRSNATSEEELSRNGLEMSEGLPSKLELGAIYKTTDFHQHAEAAPRL